MIFSPFLTGWRIFSLTYRSLADFERLDFDLLKDRHDCYIDQSIDANHRNITRMKALFKCPKQSKAVADGVSFRGWKWDHWVVFDNQSIENRRGHDFCIQQDLVGCSGDGEYRKWNRARIDEAKMLLAVSRSTYLNWWMRRRAGRSRRIATWRIRWSNSSSWKKRQ